MELNKRGRGREAGMSRHGKACPGSEPRTPFPKPLRLLPVTELMRLSFRETDAEGRARGCQPDLLYWRLHLAAESERGPEMQ